jgi:hypothetical protein
VLAQKSKEEASGKVRAMEEAEQLTEKLKSMEARLAFLLSKVQADDENRIVQAEDRKKLEAQVSVYSMYYVLCTLCILYSMYSISICPLTPYDV